MFRNPPQVSFVNFGGGDEDYDAVPFGCYDTPAPYHSFTSYGRPHTFKFSFRWMGSAAQLGIRAKLDVSECVLRGELGSK